MLHRLALPLTAFAMGALAFSGVASAQSACPPGSVYDASGQCVSQQASYTPAPATETPIDYGTHIDVGLTVAGAVTLGVGYVTSAVFGGLGNNPILFIPVVGGLIHAPLNGTGGGIALGLSLFGVQAVGLIIMIAGLAHNHPNDPRAVAEGSWVPEIIGGPGEAGAGLRWRF